MTFHQPIPFCLKKRNKKSTYTNKSKNEKKKGKKKKKKKKNKSIKDKGYKKSQMEWNRGGK